MNKILIINPGSTAIKYKTFSQKGEILDKKIFSFSEDDLKRNINFLKELEGIEKIGIRIVHGGGLKGPILIDKKIFKKIKEFEIFAPIHNKIAISEIKKIQKIFKKCKISSRLDKVKIFAVFDTDFHQTIPEENYVYPINQEMAKKYNIRKYGFHGIAIQSALNQLEKVSSKIIFVHLGGGSSVTGVKNKKSFVTSMGLTPISGLMMKTRVGDVDSDLDIILSKKMGKSVKYVSNMFSNNSGFLGMTGSVDTKKIFKEAEKEIIEKKGVYKKEKLAFDLYLKSIIEKIYGYAGLMGGVDSVVFSGGIGEGSDFLRKEVLKKLKVLNITKKDVFVISVNEEKEIFKKIIKF